MPHPSNTDFEKLIESWIRYHQKAVNSDGKALHDDNDFWAFNALVDLCNIDPELAWDIIRHLTHRVDSSELRANIGAGPLEYLLAKHGEEFVGRIVEAIHNDAKFAEVAESVWKNQIPSDVWNRFQSALRKI